LVYLEDENKKDWGLNKIHGMRYGVCGARKNLSYPEIG